MAGSGRGYGQKWVVRAVGSYSACRHRDRGVGVGWVGCRIVSSVVQILRWVAFLVRRGPWVVPRTPRVGSGGAPASAATASPVRRRRGCGGLGGLSVGHGSRSLLVITNRLEPFQLMLVLKK